MAKIKEKVKGKIRTKTKRKVKRKIEEDRVYLNYQKKINPFF